MAERKGTIRGEQGADPSTPPPRTTDEQLDRQRKKDQLRTGGFGGNGRMTAAKAETIIAKRSKKGLKTERRYIKNVRIITKKDELNEYIFGELLASGLPSSRAEPLADFGSTYILSSDAPDFEKKHRGPFVDFLKVVGSALDREHVLASSAGASGDPNWSLSEPLGEVQPYLGKRRSGPIGAFLKAAYPFRPGAAPLTSNSLQQHDSKAHTAYFNLTAAERRELNFFGEAEKGQSLIKSLGIDLATQDGLERAKRIYSALSSTLYPKRNPDR